MLTIVGIGVFVEIQSAIIQVIIPESTTVILVKIVIRKRKVCIQNEEKMRKNVQISGLIPVMMVTTNIFLNNCANYT